MCAIIAQFIRDLRLRRTRGNLAYITSVFIGYIEYWLDWFVYQRFAAKKAGEDGRNQ